MNELALSEKKTTEISKNNSLKIIFSQVVQRIFV